MRFQLLHFQRLRLHFLLPLVTLAFCVSASGADAARRTFNLPADSAGRTLKLFSEQSGRGLIMDAKIVEAITTNAVRGEFTPKEAVDRMLAGTKLVATQDEQNGAFIVVRENSAPNAPRAAQAEASDRPKQSGRSENNGAGTLEGRVLNATNGRYIQNVRVTVEGTGLETITDPSGYYRLIGVATGEARVKVSYIGLPTAEATVSVTPSQVTTRDFSLGGAADELLKLDPFLVNSTREVNSTAIAINEQRSAANIKTVMSTELVGDIVTDNIGEVMKYLPGVTLDTVSEPSGINVRGFAASFTQIQTDGAMITTASPDPGRLASISNVSANTFSRVEVTKVPTPDMPASALGGTVNLISKSAFEAARATFRYRANLSLQSDEYKLFKRTPGPGDERTFKVLPSVDFNYIVPFSKTFGISINGVSSNQYSGMKHELSSTWRFTGPAPTAAGPNVPTPTNPQLRSISYGPQHRTLWRDALGVQADWRPAKDHVISASVQMNYQMNLQDALLQVPDTGATESPTPATGVPLVFGPTFSHGATGRGVNNQQKFTYDQTHSLRQLNLTHRFTGRLWQIDSGLGGSIAKTWWRDLSEGHMFNVRASLVNVSRVLFDDIDKPSLPRKITTLDAAGREIDWTKAENYRITSVESGPRDGRNTLKQARVNVRRSLDFLPFESNLKVGSTWSQDDRDMVRRLNAWTFVGADGVANTADDSAAPFIDAKSYIDKWRFVEAQEFPSSYKLAELFKSNPNYFAQTAAQQVANETNRITRSFNLSERITTGYVQGEAYLFEHRLRVLGGARYERTDDLGRGPLFDPNAAFQRDASGRLLRVNGALVRKPEAGAAGSLQELALVRQERAAVSERSYDGYYPSLHLTFSATPSFLVRAAYAESFGRPDLPLILPNTTVGTENPAPAPGSPPGTISVTNGGLQPYAAKNYDVSLEYYFGRGGVASVGAFRKDLKNFFGTLNTIATPELLEQFGLEDTYAGWSLQSRINVGTARVSGIELNYTQPLTFLSFGGKYLSVLANYTRIRLEGPRETDFTGFIPEAASLGLTYSRKPLIVVARWNYRGQERRGVSTVVPGGFDYLLAYPSVDLSVEYQVSRHVTIFANSRNVLGAAREYRRYSDETPFYASYFRSNSVGVQTAVGIKGTF